MKVRPARTGDVPAICTLINEYAEQGLMLHRSHEGVYDSLREFLVAENDDGGLLGCCAVDIVWSNLAEIKSLAVSPAARGKGVGSKLVRAGMDLAIALGVRRFFALTYEQRFFERLGYCVCDRQTLPDKVWRECIACPKADNCDEIAVIYEDGQTPAG
ncbi:MAG: N-acetyltransferase [Phycisphaerae bacterium]